MCGVCSCTRGLGSVEGAVHICDSMVTVFISHHVKKNGRNISVFVFIHFFIISDL